jgi:glutaredoxin
VSKDREAAMEMINKSGQRGVPVIDIDGNIVVGFDQERINSILGL